MASSHIHYVKPIEDEDVVHSPNDETMPSLRMSSNENGLMTPEREEPPDIGDNALFVSYLSHKHTSSNIVFTV